MSRVRLRLLLPILHTLIDLGLLVATVLLVYGEVAELKLPSVWRQDYRPAFDVREVNVAQPLAAISIGTLPVSIISTLVFSNWLLSSPFDFRWVGLHLGLGIAFWYAVGRLTESATRWRIGLLSYVLYRLLFVPTSLGRFRNGVRQKNLWVSSGSDSFPSE